MKRSLYLASICSLFFFSACVSRPPKMGEAPPPAPQTTGPAPVETARPEPVPEPGPGEGSTTTTRVREIRGPITLVLGGAGVASFATVGVLKKLQEDGVKVEAIIASGWPAIFALGYGTMKSVHDLEWFAMRLEESDFSSGGLFGSDKGFADHDRIRSTALKAFGNANLNQTRIPIVLSSSNSSTGQPEVFSAGSWLEPLLKSISVPGTFRPFADGPGLGWIASLAGVDVDEAVRRGAKTTLAFTMYDDFLVSMNDTRTADSETLYRGLFAVQLNKNIRAALKKASAAAHLRLNRPPHDFASKRLAIQVGYQETAKLLRALNAKGQ